MNAKMLALNMAEIMSECELPLALKRMEHRLNSELAKSNVLMYNSLTYLEAFRDDMAEAEALTPEAAKSLSDLILHIKLHLGCCVECGSLKGHTLDCSFNND